MPLLLGGTGINVFRAGLPRRRPDARRSAQRRAALIGFAAGGFRVARPGRGGDLDAARRGRRAAADRATADRGRRRRRPRRTRATAPIRIADRTWLLVVRDPDRPGVGLPLLLAVVGISLAALLASLILVWSRNERMQELQREASQDPLTGLKNRRRFEEDLRTAMARSRRERHHRGAADARPRPLQAGQRHLRPPGRRPR